MLIKKCSHISHSPPSPNPSMLNLCSQECYKYRIMCTSLFLHTTCIQGWSTSASKTDFVGAFAIRLLPLRLNKQNKTLSFKESSLERDTLYWPTDQANILVGTVQLSFWWAPRWFSPNPNKAVSIWSPMNFSAGGEPSPYQEHWIHLHTVNLKITHITTGKLFPLCLPA